MSRKVDPKTVKVGDRVRVGRESDEYGAMHMIKFGAVCTVIDADIGTYPQIPQLLVEGPVGGFDDHLPQWVDVSSCKVAK